MSTTTNDRLARLLDAPLLARVVPHLAPETLHQLILHRGLDACGDVLGSATTAQLTSLLDLDLWRHPQPGHDAQFDVDRFGQWLEMLVDGGESLAVRIVASLDQDTLIAGLSRYLRVFDPGTFEPTESSDDEAIDRHEMMSSETSADVLECEVGGYLIRARRTDAWDAIVTLLVGLEIEHNDCFHAVMQQCRRLSNSRPEVDGVDDLLRIPEQHVHDVAIEREQRRSRRGYVTPADARAFLEMARQSRTSVNPIAAAYFRAVDRAENDDHVGMIELRHGESATLTRNRHLAFLANTLLAGSSIQSRSFTPKEAWDAAASICNLGLECGGVEYDLVASFEVGWSVLYRDVSLFAADRLIGVLDDLQYVDAEIRRDLRALRRKLVEQRKAGTPWHARDAADVLATMDMPAYISVLGLLDECPILPEPLIAILERRTTSVSPTAFEFISTKQQIGNIRVFMRALPSVLSG